ncbi:hypothetical protein ABNavy71_034 [Acinetobacter phage AB-Navy71]|uniref:Uncharacterized protein n=1 Tax=Acinetobacter phage AbTZA1 TaxID=2500827 RepID=A0A3Q9R717_9CAUD|nr:hypothetical protein HYP74_gp062 [Acinetobacter phage AbTZA1]AZU98673.1 hypothetical protein [Acinetobacter phage AbTZA1]UQS94111.1 hypothetical protein ABNavy71_034 [Acinetobacter phage AB-Navy71]
MKKKCILLIDSLKNIQNNVKSELKLLDSKIAKIHRTMYNERKWRIRNNRPLGAKDKARENEVQQAKESLELLASTFRHHIRSYGDAICRIREVKRGNSKKNVDDIILNLFTSL